MKDKVLLIIPCFNEEKRINLASFKNSDENIHFIFANDGSTDKTIQVVSQLEDKNRFFIFDSKENFGKANIIQKAYKEAQKQINYSDYNWIGYWDADLATPLEEVNNMITANNGQLSSIWGSRIYKLGSKIERSKLRHYLGRIFATIASTLLKIKSYDSQCGAKLFRPKVAETAFAQSFKTNWIFDIEILLKINQDDILEYPLSSWTDVEGSKVNIKKELFRVLKDLYVLWKTYKKHD